MARTKNKLPAGIVLTDSGRYKATISFGSGNTRKRKSKTFDTFTDADMWLKIQHVEKNEGATYFADDYLVTHVFVQWVRKYVEGKVEPATLRTYQNTLQMLKHKWGNMKIKDVTRTKLQTLFNDLLDDGLTKNTVQKYRTHLNKLFKDLVLERVYRDNPMQGIDVRGAKRGKKPEEKVLNIEQYKTLINYLKNQPVEKMTAYEMIILVLLNTGLRVSEAIDLKQDDLDEMNSTLRVDSSYDRYVKDSKKPKTDNSYRTIQVPRSLINKIKAWGVNQQRAMFADNWRNTEQRLFLTNKGDVPSLNMVNYWVHKLEACVLDLPKNEQTSTHSIRHTVASFLLSTEGGHQSLQFVAAYLGDTQTTVQETYSHLLDEERTKKSAQVASLMENIV